MIPALMWPCNGIQEYMPTRSAAGDTQLRKVEAKLSTLKETQAGRAGAMAEMGVSENAPIPLPP